MTSDEWRTYDYGLMRRIPEHERADMQRKSQRELLISYLQRSPDGDVDAMLTALRQLAKNRSLWLQRRLVGQCGTRIQAGPFAGMEFAPHQIAGCHMPKLLGSLESELHPFIYSMPQAQYDTILNIGCAEGYYAVGLKRMLPQTRMIAFDVNPQARRVCAQVAAFNKVDVEIEEVYRHEDFARFPGRTLVFCDIEGDEIELIDPENAPSLRYMDLVVELHRMPVGHARDIVPPRFRESHDIQIVEDGSAPVNIPPSLRGLLELDRLLCLWEWRSHANAWAIMKARSLGGPAKPSTRT
jgi:hypothetical protein